MNLRTHMEVTSNRARYGRKVIRAQRWIEKERGTPSSSSRVAMSCTLIEDKTENTIAMISTVEEFMYLN